MKTLYKNFRLYDGTKDMTLKEGLFLLVEDGRIKTISSNISEAADREVDLHNNFLLPGLINMHVHIPANGFPKKKETDQKKLAKIVNSSRFTQKVAQKVLCNGNVKTQLLSGCTTIRAVGGVGHIDSMIRNDIEKGKIVGPRLLVCDYAVTVPNGHMEGTVSVGARTPEEFVSYIQDNVKNGVDWIKIMVTGGVLDAKVKGEPGEMKMTPEQIRLCCDTAHKLGKKVCAHVESPQGVEIALENGVDCIEHGAYMTDKAISLFKEKKAYEICTLSPAIPLARFDTSVSHAQEIVVYNSEVLLEGMIDGVKNCLKNHITVGLGTDTGCPFVTQYDMWRELEYFHKLCNVSRKEALYTATLVNASILGLDKETGSIEEGKAADFIVCEKDPFEGFAALRKLEMVVARGVEYAHPQIKKNAECEAALDNFMATL